MYTTSDNLNTSGYSFLILFSMLYMAIMLCSAILTNRYVGYNNIFILGGTLISPLLFIMDDIIAEVYGYKIARNLIIIGFIAQTMFALACQAILNFPYPTFFTHQEDYNYLLGISLLRINFSGFFAYITANLINSYILTRWKVILKGKKFWLRSIGSSTISEALYSFMAIMMMEINSIPIGDILKVVGLSYTIKAIYSIIFAMPGNILVSYVKVKTGIDVFDVPKNFIPSDFFKKERKYHGKNRLWGANRL